MRERSRSRAETYAMAQLRIKTFEKLKATSAKHAAFLLEKHFMHVDRLIDYDIR